MPDPLYMAVRPMLAVSGGRIVLLSTPFVKRGFFHEEVRHYFTIPTSELRVAEEFATQKHKELSRQFVRRGQGLPSTIRCSQLFDRFERQDVPALAPGTQDAYSDSLKSLRAYFVGELRDPTIDAIHARHVRDFLAWRRVHRFEAEREGKKPTPIGHRTPLNNRTLQKDRAVLHRIFEIAEQLELRDGNPVSRVSAPKSDGRDPVILSVEQYEGLLSECAGRPIVWLYVLTLGEAGLRNESEALRLRWKTSTSTADFCGSRAGETSIGRKAARVVGFR